MLVRFWVNHHLLDLTQRPIWRVVKDRSRTYVQKILAGISHPYALCSHLSQDFTRDPNCTTKDCS